MHVILFLVLFLLSSAIDLQRVEELLSSPEGDVEELKDVLAELVMQYSELMKEEPPVESLVVDPAQGEVAPVAPPKPCTSHLGCDTCVAANCAWCIAARACREDVPWQCQGDVDHISLSGIGRHSQCPTAEELAQSRKRRSPAKADDEERGETGKQGGGEEATDKGEEAQYESTSKSEHVSELKRRAQLAQSSTSGPAHGAQHPYETLGLASTASSSEVRKGYRKLSLLFHPDKQIDAELKELATKAFSDIVAAFEILGSPEKRAFFDDLGGADGEQAESFNSQAAYEKWGRKNEANFYQGHAYITPLSESLWQQRVGRGEQLWLVEFYAPWCGHCQQLVPVYKQVAEQLKEEDDIEVGAVNCATEEAICSRWFGIRAYPTLLALNDKHGTRQEFKGPKDAASILAWVRQVSREWRYLLSQGRLNIITTQQQFDDIVFNTTDFPIVVFMDGLDCVSCKTAKTNAMRLSASLRGYEGVSVSVVDCDTDAMEAFCASQDLPSRPFAPVVKGYAIGNKTSETRGRVLYNSNEVEPHVALQMIDSIVRLVLADRLKVDKSVGVMPGDLGYDKEGKEEEEKKNEEPPDLNWDDGPGRRVPVEWGGDEERILNAPRLGQ